MVKVTPEETLARTPSGRNRGKGEKRKSVGSGMFLLSLGAIGLAVAGLFFAFGGRTPPRKEPAATPSAVDAKSAAPADSSEGSGKPNAYSMLFPKLSPEEEKAQDEFAKLFDGLKPENTAEKIKRLERFVAKTPADFDIVPRARAMLSSLKSAPANAKPAPPAVKPATLVGHWLLNDGSGLSAPDSSGSKLNGKLVNGAEWADKALSFNGVDSYVDLPNSETMDHLQEGDFTVCAWFKPASDPAEEADHNHCGYTIIMKGGNHTGLSYYHGGYFSMDMWLAGNVRVNANAGPLPPAVYYHVCGTVSRTNTETKLFINGKMKGQKFWNSNAPSRPYGSQTWKIGEALPNAPEWAWPAKGLIRDVRLYRGVLSDAEIEALARDTK